MGAGRWRRGPWGVATVAGTLIVLAVLVARGLGSDPVSDALMVLAAVVAGTPIARAAVRGLRVGAVPIDLLVTIASMGAVVTGEYWEAAAVTFLFAVGHALEARTISRTRSALAELVAVAPAVAVVLRDGRQVEVAAAAVAPGETVVVKNGTKVPVDGEVTGGSGAVDESSITGESIPVEKAAGDRVFAGTVSAGGVVQVRATGVGADTTLARIIHRVEEAQDARAATQAFIDRFSRWYTPGVVVLALVAGLATGDVALALTLLVIGCPGALVISIPVAIVAGIGRAARDGILIKGGEFLETTARIDVVAVDKTGTLTEGRPHLTDVVVLDPALDRTAVLRWAAVAEAGSEHPLARPVLEAAAAEGLGAPGMPDRTEPVPGKGVVAWTGGRRVAVGTTALLAEHGVDGEVGRVNEAVRVADGLADAGRTPMLVAVDGAVVGVLAVADRVRPEAAEAVRRLRAGGVRRVVMLTGDTHRVAAAVAAATGVDEVRAGLLPEDKLEAVRELQRAGHTVAMVGDGVNDAPALATADAGVAMGAAGSAVAVETADIALMGDDLLRLPEAIGLARRTVAVMRQNIAAALVTVALLLVGVVAGGVTMAVGMLVHEASVLVVIANATRLLRRRPARRPPQPRRSRSARSTTRPTLAAASQA
nr:cation-translocating P-type ATPase [uncultured Actinotalea sp.]